MEDFELQNELDEISENESESEDESPPITPVDPSELLKDALDSLPKLSRLDSAKLLKPSSTDLKKNTKLARKLFYKGRRAEKFEQRMTWAQLKSYEVIKNLNYKHLKHLSEPLSTKQQLALSFHLHMTSKFFDEGNPNHKILHFEKHWHHGRHFACPTIPTKNRKRYKKYFGDKPVKNWTEVQAKLNHIKKKFSEAKNSSGGFKLKTLPEWQQNSFKFILNMLDKFVDNCEITDLTEDELQYLSQHLHSTVTQLKFINRSSPPPSKKE